MQDELEPVPFYDSIESYEEYEMSEKEILNKLTKIEGRVDGLADNLYGMEDHPNDMGDIPKIHMKLDAINSRSHENETRSKVNRYLIGAILALGGGSAGITKLLELW